MRSWAVFTYLILDGASGTIGAAELRVLPSTIALTGPVASQRLLAVSLDNNRVAADRTAESRFTSSDPKVATVDADGIVRATGDGTATITATSNGETATASVTMSQFKTSVAWSYREHILPALTKAGCNSGSCHGALAGKGGFKLSLRAYDPETDFFVMTRQAGGRRVDRTSPEQSLVLLKPTKSIPHGGGKRFETDSPEYRRLREWIASGAVGPRSDEPALTRLEVFPAAASLKPQDKLRIVVRAQYSDGHAEDVTPWAKFTSSEDLVATVDDDGLLTVTGPGEVAINVRFATQVAGAIVTVPRAAAVDPAVFAQSPRHNFIDELVLNKLAALRIPPSLPASDAEFVRRAFLDCAGTLPTPEEVEKFVRDSSPDKKARLIDGLLERPEYVDYWSYKWSDLFLVSSRKLFTPQMWAFYRHLRRVVAENHAWDRIARELLTAQGSSLTNGAASYFLMHKEVPDLTETTSVTFLGLSIACAKCHNHPLEKWTQDQYWAFANLFSRVAEKNGDVFGDIVVQSLAHGDVSHPRRGKPMPPAALDAPPIDPADGRDRRAVFADWLTSPSNPYFAKALVNRVWKNFMGRGLVEAEDDLRQTNPPTNPELLDKLAQEFIAHKYDLKWLIRTITASAAYQQSSRPSPGNESDDRFYSRYLIRRLPAEVILDAYSQLTGVPTPFNEIREGGGGPPRVPINSYPLGLRAQQLPDVQLISRFLDTFGRPERVQTCACERNGEASVGQALHLNNGKTLNDKLRDKASIVSKWIDSKADDATVVRDLYRRALSREPTAEELRKLGGIVAEAKDDRRAALEDLVWGVLTGREFVFNR